MQTGMLVAGKYRIERIVGRGGMGLVVEATHIHLDARVALKFLAEEMAADPTALARFRREAQASAQLKSEHICRVSDVGVEGKTPFIVMELLVGTDLARLSKVRTLDVTTAALYIKQACAGLAEAHAAKIIHRDLKPGNLFLTRRADGSPLIKILDFGVAKAPDAQDGKLTATANVVGSPGFMSPEQFRSSKSVDERADIWALGVILYKLVSGRLPFKADGFAEFALAITRDSVPPLPEVPPPFEKLIARCLEKDPSKRYPDVIQLGEALTPFTFGSSSSSPHIYIQPPPESDEIPSGYGGQDAPDSGMRTRILGSDSMAPPIVDAVLEKSRAALAATPPAGVPLMPTRPIGRTTPVGGSAVVAKPSGGAPAKQTILGVSLAEAAPAGARATAAVAPSNVRPTAMETAMPQATVAGTGVGLGGRRFVPGGDLAPGTPVGEYVIDQKIGQGGMGVVYSATHPMIGKRAAIKVIGADLGTDAVVVQRFVQEARSVNQIGHPNIVDVFAFGKLPDGRNYFVMEYLQGESLRARLYRAFMSIPESVQILDEVANALEAAHEKQIVHRDLKPDNVYLATVRGGFIRVKLLDFGIAKLSSDGGIAKTSTGELMGTPSYLSPEQARGRNVDNRTDIYALGCMMYEMITGRLPFMAESPMDIILMHISATPRKPSELKPDIPPLLEQIIMQMLDKDPAKRPTLVNVRNVFAELVASGSVQLEPGSGSTFRSDLVRTPRSSPRNQIGDSASSMNALVPAAPVVAPDALTTSGRRRSASPSEQPTSINFNPGAATITPSDRQPTSVHAAAASSAPRKGRGVLFAILALVLAVPAAAIGYGLLAKKGSTAPSDAPPVAVAVTGLGTADAAVALATPDASAPAAVDAGVSIDAAPAPAAKRSVIVRASVPRATLEIDGVAVESSRGIARLDLTEGSHHVVVKAPGYTTFDKVVEVAEGHSEIIVKLERARKQTGTSTTSSTTTSTPANTGTPTNTATPTPPTTKQGSATKKDETIDPFAQ